jgi:hypothetical protein
MEIHLRFDHELMLKYERRDSPLVFGIWWNHNGLDYPEHGWIDFGVVVIGWWFTSISSLWKGTPRTRFSFMDGPYGIVAKRMSGKKNTIVELLPEGENVTWYIMLDELTQRIVKAADEVRIELTHTNIAEATRLDLEGAIKDLTEEIAKYK